jgi:predicted NBD/HSP70 family sugar kinase
MISGYVVDIGGTKISFGILGLFSIEPECKIETPSTSVCIIDEIAKQIKKFDEKYSSSAKKVIISCPGLITNDGKVEKSLYVPLEGVNLKQALENKIKKKVIVENDANIQGLGKHKQTDLLYMVIGTAVGGSIIYSDEKIYKGNSGFAGEFGHIYVGGKEKCFCGNIGCLDTIVSGRSMIEKLGDCWWEKMRDTNILDYIKIAGVCTGKALARLAILFDPGEISLCGNICKISQFKESVINGFRDESWAELQINFSNNSWENVFNGAMKILSQN